ncbi:Cyclin-I [Nibea albiflora]|uniref:Cyclin-I n=1 Tax=Nibea albiflora TaxID=240163 RepID=A0ACB7FD18_NIBAL|nr:Cyclin-I [Nibea albiflora]
MKFFEPWGRQRLSFLLEKAASREAKMWRIYVPKKPSSQDTDISPAQRDEAVRWLTELHGRLQLYPETLVLAVSILDRFLAPIKARPKYLRCIAIACFFLAAKTCEEDEFHAMVLSCRSGFLDSMLGLNRSQHLGLLTRQLYHCLADHTLMQLRGSMLALALITLELENCCPDWLALTIDLLRKAQIDSSELIRSRELVARSLSTLRASLPPNTVYIYQPLQQDLTSSSCTPGIITSTTESSRDHALAQPQTPAGGEEGSQWPWGSVSSSSTSTNSNIPALLSPPKHLRKLNNLRKVTLRCKASAKRKVEEMEVDDFYDGIKRLYNEDITTTTAAVQEGATPAMGVITTTGGGGGGGGLGGCSVLLSRQEGSTSPCPPLQPVSAS